jgi:thiamine-phosphate pyrophosphorylase
MEVVANGRSRAVEDGATVEELIRSLGLDPRFVIVERNGEPLERKAYAGTRLSQGDRLELVRAVAGGADEGSTRRDRLAGARLYVVTDARARQGDLKDFLEAILEAGCDVVQLREKDAEAGDLMRWGEIFREATSRHGALFIVNDRPDVAVALDADGVHLGQNDLPPEVARTILGRGALIGLSCHSAEDHARAPAEADYLTAGPVWATPTKPGRPGTGLELVRRAARSVDRAWFAIGGIDPTNLRDVVRAGATRVVVVRAVTEAEDPAAAVRALLAGLP